MAEQAVDLRSLFSILRRHRRALAVSAAVGATAGFCSVLLWPPLFSSTSLVLLPPAQDASGQAITRDVDTVIRVAGSDAVLGSAGQKLNPPMSAQTLAQRVQVTAPTTDVVQFEGSAETPARAQAITRAVASAEVSFVTESSSSLTAAQQAALAARKKELQSSLDSVNQEIDATTARKQRENPSSSQGKADASALAQLTSQQANLVLQLDQIKSTTAGITPTAGASIIQGASPAKRPVLLARYLVATTLGLLLAVAVTAGLLAAFGRRDRTLRYRDQIADAVGSAVIASVRSHVHQTVAGWRSLLKEYHPGTVDAWALRQALRQLEAEESMTAPRRPGPNEGNVHHPQSVTVVSLSGDMRGLAVGPQLAAYAASAGIRTRLVAAQGHESTAALWAACSAPPADAELRSGLLVDTGPRSGDDADMTVSMVVVDKSNPQLLELTETSVTVLALSPGTATAEDVARAAVKADDCGKRIAGVIVADPDNLDRTTGRLLRHERSQQVPLPTRLTGVPAAKVARTSTPTPRRRPG